MQELPAKFRLAKMVSELSEFKIRVGAVIYRGSRVVSFANNYLKSHPKFAREYASIHAEISCILKSQTDLTGCSIYVFRQFKNKKPANSKPCSDCLKVIIASGIKTVYFTTDSGYDILKL